MRVLRRCVCKRRVRTSSAVCRHVPAEDVDPITLIVSTTIVVYSSDASVPCHLVTLMARCAPAVRVQTEVEPHSYERAAIAMSAAMSAQQRQHTWSGATAALGSIAESSRHARGWSCGLCTTSTMEPNTWQGEAKMHGNGGGGGGGGGHRGGHRGRGQGRPRKMEADAEQTSKGRSCSHPSRCRVGADRAFAVHLAPSTSSLQPSAGPARLARGQ